MGGAVGILRADAIDSEVQGVGDPVLPEHEDLAVGVLDRQREQIYCGCGGRDGRARNLWARTAGLCQHVVGSGTYRSDCLLIQDVPELRWQRWTVWGYVGQRNELGSEPTIGLCG